LTPFSQRPFDIWLGLEFLRASRKFVPMHKLSARGKLQIDAPKL